MGTASASHNFTVLSVREARAYRHVLEEDDRLVLARYAISEIPAEEEEPYGGVGAVLSVEVDGDTLKRQTPPASGYALVAFYWTETDASDLPWEDDGAVAVIRGNPTLFTNPQEHAQGIIWRASASLEATAQQLGEDAKEMLRSIETDDPDIDFGDLVSSSAITLAGAEYIASIMPQIVALAPEAFDVSASPVAADPAASGEVGAFLTTTTPTLSKYEFTKGLQRMGVDFGIPFSAMGLIALVAIVAAIAAILMRIGGAIEVLPQHGGFILVFGALVGAIHWAAALIVIVLVVMVGSGALVKRIIP